MEERRSITLPPSIITIPSPPSASTPLQLKIYVAPTISIPSPPFSDAVRSVKAVEECVEVIVPIGGKVALDITARSERLDGYAWGESSGSQGGEHEVLRLVEACLRSNAEAIGVSAVRRSFPKDDPEHQNAEEQTVKLQLVPHAANPAIHARLSTLLISGEAVAHLEKLDIRLSWVPPGPRGFARKRPSEQPEGAEGGEEEEDEIYLDDGEEEEDVYLDDEEDEIYLDDEVEEQDPGDTEDPSPDTQGDDDEDGALPRWKLEQLQDGLGRLLRVHLLKRFPLVFDPGLQNYTARLTLPYSLSSSLFDIFTLSSSYSPRFHKTLVKALKGINTAQMAIIQEQTTRIIHLPESAKAKAEARKRRRIGNPGQSESQSSGGESQGSQSSASPRKIQELDKEEKIEVHIQAVKRLRNPPDEVQTRKRDEMGMKKLLAESIGVIGKYTWGEARKGRGKLSANRLPLQLDLEGQLRTVSLEGDISVYPTTDPPEGSDSSDDEFAPDDEIEDDDAGILDEEDSQLPNLLDHPQWNGGEMEEDDEWADDDSILEDEDADDDSVEEELLKTPPMNQYRDPADDVFPDFADSPPDGDDADDNEEEDEIYLDDDIDTGDPLLSPCSPLPGDCKELPEALEKMQLEMEDEDEDEMCLDDGEDEIYLDDEDEEQ